MFFTGRNMGFCREPGVYQALLVFALLFQIFFLKKNACKILIYTIAVATTLSTTGYISLLFILILFFYQHKDLNVKNLFFVIFVLILIALVFFYTDLLSSNGAVFEKFYRTSYHDGDTIVSRIASVYCNISIFLENMMFGAGIYHTGELFPKYSLETFGVSTGSNTNTILFTFASQGVVYGSLVSLFFLYFSKCITKNKIETFLVFLILITECCGELFIYSGWFYVFTLYGFKEYKKTLLETN